MCGKQSCTAVKRYLHGLIGQMLAENLRPQSSIQDVCTVICL
jgi:hypothetical protein